MKYFSKNEELDVMKSHLYEMEKSNMFNIRLDLKEFYDEFNDIINMSDTFNGHILDSESYHNYRVLKNIYRKICKEIVIKTKLPSTHGMNPKKASEVNLGGHEIENKFEKEHNFNVIKGTQKEDLMKDGLTYSVKSGRILQWALKKFDHIDDSLKFLLKDWTSIFESVGGLSLQDRNTIINSLICDLKDKNNLSKLVSYFISDFYVNRLIIRNLDNDKDYYNFSEYNMVDFVNLVTEKSEIDRTPDKGSIILKIPIDGKLYTCFSLEYRTDKTSLYFRSNRKNILRFLNEYKIDTLNKYQLKK